MQISTNPLPPNIAQLLNNEPVKTAVERYADGSTEEGSFANILSEAFSTTNTTDHIDKAHTMELLFGESDDLSGMLVDMQKAELALQLTLQIRNKILDAYNEVMRMSV